MQSLKLAIGMSLFMVSAGTPAIGDNKWDFEVSDSACFAGTNSLLGNDRLQLSWRDEEIGGVIFTDNDKLQDLPVEKVITALGFSSAGNDASTDEHTIKLGFLLVGFHGKWREEDPKPGTFLLVLEPYRLIDSRLLQREMLFIFAYDATIGPFSLNGAEEAVSKLLTCDLHQTLDKFGN